jgi:hypothetical protein
VFGVSFEGSFGVLLNVFTLFFSIDWCANTYSDRGR